MFLFCKGPPCSFTVENSYWIPQPKKLCWPSYFETGAMKLHLNWRQAAYLLWPLAWAREASLSSKYIAQRQKGRLVKGPVTPIHRDCAMYFSSHVFGRSLKGSSFAAQMYGNFEGFPLYCLFQEQGSQSSEGCQSELGYVLFSLSCFVLDAEMGSCCAWQCVAGLSLSF